MRLPLVGTFEFMPKYLFAVLLPLLAAFHASGQGRTAECLSVLKEAMAHNSQFLVRMHAAEALIGNGYTNNVAGYFPLRRHMPSIETTGSARVRARLHRRKAMERRIIKEFLHADSARARLTALESLAKIGFSKPLRSITAQADTGSGGFRAMALWVLANNGTAQGEERLAALLASDVPAESYYAAYALRFRQRILPATYRLLDSCARAVTTGSTGSVLVLSSFYAHAAPERLAEARAALLNCLQGNAGDRYQVAEGLALRGGPADLPVLERMLADENEDVRVAAANAILHIEQRNKQ